MNRSLGKYSSQCLSCFVSWKWVAGTRRALAVMLQWVNQNINNLPPLCLYKSSLCYKETYIFLCVLMVLFFLQPSETPIARNRRKAAQRKKKIKLLRFTLILWIRHRAFAGFWRIVLQILGHLLFMETWFLKAKDKNGMLSSRLCPKGMQIGMQVSLMCYNQLKNVSRYLARLDSVSNLIWIGLTFFWS